MVWVHPDHVAAVEEMYPDPDGHPRTGVVLHSTPVDYEIALPLQDVIASLWPKPRSRACVCSHKLGNHQRDATDPYEHFRCMIAGCACPSYQRRALPEVALL
jgi:hypothetical protein